MEQDALKKEARQRAARYENQYYGCSQATLLALQEVLGLEDEQVYKAASHFCGGLAFGAKLCGALSAGLMILGMKYGRANVEEGLPALVKGIMPAHKFILRFEQEFGTTVCAEIMGVGKAPETMSEEVFRQLIGDVEAIRRTHEAVKDKCAEVVGKTAEMVIEIIDETERESAQ